MHYQAIAEKSEILMSQMSMICLFWKFQLFLLYAANIFYKKLILVHIACEICFFLKLFCSCRVSIILPSFVN